jgi:hypothetical protein
MSKTTAQMVHAEFADEKQGIQFDMSDAEEAALRKALLWKLDTRVLPVLAFLFLFSFLDRTNMYVRIQRDAGALVSRLELIRPSSSSVVTPGY